MVTEAQAGGSAVPEAVAMEAATEEVEVAMSMAEVMEGTTPDPEVPAALEIITGIHVDVLPESSTVVVVRSPEIQDAEPIRSAPMVEAMTTSHDGVELLADDLVDPATVARNLESMRRAEQWMKVCCRTLSSQIHALLST
jgi:hypothetical protein